MSNKQISVDELLSRQAEGKNYAIIEAIPDRADRVMITPFVGGAPLRSHSIAIPKSSIAGVAAKKEGSDCCGKEYQVVEVAFADETVKDVFEQIGESASRFMKSLPDIVSAAVGKRPESGSRSKLFRADDAESGMFDPDAANIAKCALKYALCLTGCGVGTDEFSPERYDCIRNCNHWYDQCKMGHV